MKWTAGPVVARAQVAGIRQFEACTPDQLRTAVSGFALFDLSRYWESLPPRFDAVAVYLYSEEWLDEPLAVSGRSHGSSWIVLASSEERKQWMTAPLVEVQKRVRDPRGPRTAPPSLRFAVFKRDSFTCQYCGRRAPEFPLHVDHVVPWASGGRTELSNLRTACSECNLGKSDSSV